MPQAAIKTIRRIRIIEDDRADQLPKRRFVEYRLSREGQGGGFEIVDIFDEFNLVTDEYERRREPTRIRIPDGAGQEFIAACTEIRRELDRYGLKIFFDSADVEGFVRPKWRYRLDGRMCTDFARVCPETDDGRDPYESDPDVVPIEIADLVSSDREYYRSREWKEWFGRKLQRKREQIVVRGALGRLLGIACVQMKKSID